MRLRKGSFSHTNVRYGVVFTDCPCRAVCGGKSR